MYYEKHRAYTRVLYRQVRGGRPHPPGHKYCGFWPSCPRYMQGYKHGWKFCKNCSKWVKRTSLRCPCCHLILRCVAKNPTGNTRIEKEELYRA